MRELKVVAGVLALAALAVVSTPASDPPTSVSFGVGVFGSGASSGPGSGASDSFTPSASGGTAVDEIDGSGRSSAAGRPGSGGPSGPTGPAGGAQAGRVERGGSAGPGAPSPTASGAVGPGITDDTITVGIGWFDVNSARAAFGAPGQGEGDSPTTREGAQRVVDWINANGGIAGREVVPAYHEYPINEIATNDSRDRREQAMCADWTEDNIAFAAIPFQDGQGVFYKCAAEKGLVGLSTFTTGGGAIDEQRFAEIGQTWWAPNWISGERRERVVVEQLDRVGFFEPGARVGLFLGDTPPARRTAESTLKPMLAERGVNVVAEVYARDLSDPWSSYIFQLQSAGVTHIVGGQSSCGAGICLALIQLAAENQGYRPKYGVGTDWGAGQADLYAPPPEQMANTVSIGWSPRTDIGNDDYNVAEPINEYDARCRQIIKDSGLDISMHLVTPYCDGLFMLRDGLARAPELTWQGFRQGIESAGSGIMVATTYGTVFGPGRHDGSSYVRDMAYDRERQTWQYVGPPIPVG